MTQKEHLKELLIEKAQLEIQSRATYSDTKGLVSQDVISPDQQIPAQNVPGQSNSGETGGNFPVAHVSDTYLLVQEFIYQISSGAIHRILSLSVDRWIGLEGVMAVVAYPEKSMELLQDAALEKREKGGVTKFQIVANSHYRWIDSSEWRFASLPGPVAFLFFSGSKWVVLLGMALFVVVLQLSEKMVLKLTSNPFLCSLFSFTLANKIAQMGVAPRMDIPFYSMILAFVFFVYFLQSEKHYKLIRKLVGNRNCRSAA